MRTKLDSVTPESKLDSEVGPSPDLPPPGCLFPPVSLSIVGYVLLLRHREPACRGGGEFSCVETRLRVHVGPNLPALCQVGPRRSAACVTLAPAARAYCEYQKSS